MPYTQTVWVDNTTLVDAAKMNKIEAGIASLSAPTPSTTPPASPADGDIWYMNVDEAGGMTWQFRYRAGASNGYRWEFVGGPAYYYPVDTSETCSSASPVDLATAGPLFTAPRAGYYLFDFSAVLGQGATTTYSAGVSMTVGDLQALTMLNGAGVGWNASLAGFGKALLTNGQQTKVRYQTAGGPVTFAYRRLLVRPICVS